MDGFSTLVNALSDGDTDNSQVDKFATFGPVHLNITDIERATEFWTRIVGMKQRSTCEDMAEFGTEDQTLIVVHQTARTGFKKGYSGLYHLAIHAPNASAFASMVNRLSTNNYPFSPVDHTMSKSVYFDDPDGINVEIALETPERFKRVISTGGLKIEGSDGIVRSASDRLDLDEVLSHLDNKSNSLTIHEETYIGHLHLYANSVEKSNEFYKRIGFLQFNFLPQYMYADVGAGGSYKHRVAMNSWHGQNRPLAPEDSAGMRHFQIIFNSKEKLAEAVKNLTDFDEKDGSYLVSDPTGNKLYLTCL